MGGNLIRVKVKIANDKKIYTEVYKGGTFVPAILSAFDAHPVTSGSEENEAFFDSTPSGLVQLFGVREWPFEPGDEVYVDFSLAKKRPPIE